MSTFFLSLILTVFIINLGYVVYAQDLPFDNDNSQQQDSHHYFQTFIPSYNLQKPFLILNGTDFIDLSHNDSLSLQDFTIAAWFITNQSTLLDSAHIVNKGGFNSEKEGENMNYGIWISRNGTIEGGFETESGENFQVNSTTKYNDGKWHYVLLSYNGSLLRLDIDGEKQTSTTKQTNGALPDTTGEQPLRIGANALEENKFFTGYIDEVRVWNRALSEEEILQIYTNNNLSSLGQIIYKGFKEKDTSKIPADTSKTTTTTTTTGPATTKPISETTFNIAVAADWGCEENTEKTVENMQKMNPEIVIAAGDLSYDESAACWFEIIQPLKSKMKIAMGDHEYSDTSGGAVGVVNQYLKPLNLTNTYYSFDINNVHVTVIDPYIDYGSTSAQYQFIENDLKIASDNPNIDWIFTVQSKPMYTSPSKHDANTNIRDTYHPLFDKYGVDLVLSSDNHNYQRTFPLKYNSNVNDNSSLGNPIIVDKNQNNYNKEEPGQIYLIVGTAGRSLYGVEEQAFFVAKQSHDHFGFLNIEIDTSNTNDNNNTSSSLTATFYSNEEENENNIDDNTLEYNVNTNQNIIDQFTISKSNK
jgi:hypothetical protein